MAAIQTTIGLITGMPIADTVESLMKIAARPRELLAKRTETLKNEQLAVVELSALLVSVKYVTDNLGKPDLFEKRTATSSNANVLAATVTGSPTDGTYQFTPLKTAVNQQYLSTGFASTSQPLAAGQMTFRFGDNVQRSSPLEVLNGGQGFQRGKIRITDRSGASAQIDLSTARSIDDVLEAINNNTTINVTAVARGDGFQLIDNTGASVSNLKVQEVAGGSTAASLGLANIDIAASTADGDAVVYLDGGLDLDWLNDGNGVKLASKSLLGDIRYTLRDGTTGTIDFSPLDEEVEGQSVSADPPNTLGELLDVFNAAEPDKLQIAIVDDHLVVTDLTMGEGEFTLESSDENGSQAVEDLGLSAAADGNLITGRRLLGGTASVLLSSLNGGQGLGALGTLELTDRAGAFDTVDLSAADTLEDVVDAINLAEVGITAQINQAKNGIELIDTTGATTSNLIVANGVDSSAADLLGIAVDDAVSSINGGDLHLQVVSHSTRLADYNGGAGVAAGKITIINSDGFANTITLRASSSNPMESINDVIEEINRVAIGVVAELNDTGDGIRLRDTAGGAATLKVLEDGGTTAADLHLLGEAATVTIGEDEFQIVDGATTQVVEIKEGDTIDDLQTKINALSAGVAASLLNDGSSKPYRLSLRSDESGDLGRMVLDMSQLGLSLDEIARGQDAVLALGGTGGSSAGVLVSSHSNRFANVIDGVALNIKEASDSPVTVSITQSDADLSASIQVFVDNYNKFREHLNTLTAWDETTQEGAILFGDSAAVRLDSELSMLISGRFRGVGSIQSLAELGIDIKQNGMLSYDSTKFKARFAADPEAVKEFFTTAEFGMSDKFEKALDSMTAQDVSLLAQRYLSLTSKIEQNEERLVFLDERLKIQENRLYMQFYRMELAIGKMQSNLSALEAISPLTPYTGVSSE